MRQDIQHAVDALIDSRPPFASMEPARQPKPVKINDFIYMSEGTSNAYMVLTEAGRVIINTGLGVEARVHKLAFDSICPGPTPYILITQGHVDHVGGVDHFREDTTTFVAQANNAACQQDDQRIAGLRASAPYIWFAKTLDLMMEVAQQNPELLIQDKPLPDLSFERRHCLSVGGVDFELISAPGGETIDNSVVWLPQHKILFSGNTFGPLFPHFPNINTIRGDKYRFIEPYLETLRELRALQPELLITGHFEPIVGKALIAACLDRLEAAVDYVHSETLRRMNAGEDIYTLMHDITLPANLRVGVGYGKISWAVRTIWESYMGWFKAQRSSELYATQPHDIYGELTAICGIEAILECGHKALRSGDKERCLHFTEVALAAQPDHPGALQLSLQVHRALLQEAPHNFWEAGWLKDQIRLRETALEK